MLHPLGILLMSFQIISHEFQRWLTYKRWIQYSYINLHHNTTYRMLAILKNQFHCIVIFSSSSKTVEWFIALGTWHLTSYKSTTLSKWLHILSVCSLCVSHTLVLNCLVVFYFSCGQMNCWSILATRSPLMEVHCSI